ncbi:hypothetical protein J5Y03_15955 [Bacillus sp. RG28]|uniref:Uncharacterized protein n=1 Tax=Gottfriedia endophytica TaxID=2820819 RepID=A0A940NSC7_9BACI|nr:hypothetical protein [Gottfriedia endophytica]MBP0726653.1 hypothetical protein [Gottfriedia endophytica]
MFLNGAINYLEAWELLNEKYPEEYFDIIGAIENLNFQLLQGNYESLREFRNSWELFLNNGDWSYNNTKTLIGQKKNMTTVKLLIGSNQEVINSWLFRMSNLAIKNKTCEIPILILPMKEVNIYSSGLRNRMLANFERTLSILKELSPLSLDYPFLILGISEQETPFEIFNISSNIEGHNANIIMNRSIEFPPEYYQAGLGVLSYFHKILKEKYPGTQATVKIIQEGLVVKMIVETEDGNRHIVEKALEEYDLIVKGEIKPEEYFDAPAQILELKSELRIAQLRIETQSDLLTYQKGQIDKFMEIISNGLINPALPAIHVSPVITVETSLNHVNNIHNELNNTIETIRDLKNKLNSPNDIRSLSDVESALTEIDANNLKSSKGVQKLQKLIENINNAESSISKSINTTNEGIQLMKKLAKHYNTIAPWCGLPQIPFIK